MAKALILAAGFGSRLMPLTQNCPKCMVEYFGKKIIDYELEALLGTACNLDSIKSSNTEKITQIAIVGGYKIEILKEYLNKNYKEKITKIYENPQFDKTNMVQTLLCAREFIENAAKENEDLIISYADIIYSKSIVNALLAANDELNIVVDTAWANLWEKRFFNPLEDAETLKIRDGKIFELGKKAQNYEQIQAQYIGLFKFRADFLESVLKFYDELDKDAIYDGKDFLQMYMTSFLQGLIDKFGGATPIKTSGKWCEIDFKSDLEIDIRAELD